MLIVALAQHSGILGEALQDARNIGRPRLDAARESNWPSASTLAIRQAQRELTCEYVHCETLVHQCGRRRKHGCSLVVHRRRYVRSPEHCSDVDEKRLLCEVSSDAYSVKVGSEWSFDEAKMKEN